MTLTWDGYDRWAARVMAPFEGQYREGDFEYRHVESLQPTTPARFRKTYAVKVAYTAWGDSSLPLLVCLGGVANVARRFDYLGLALRDAFHVVCLDWLGRGHSGWLHDVGDYSLATYAAQLHQLLDHLGAATAHVLGSSMGGSVAMAYAAKHPQRVARLVLNDIGPHMPVDVRARRAEVLARHYAFRSPDDMLRRVGASQKNDGPVSDDVRLHNTHAQTRWSNEEGGRVYRHDPRAMLAYRDGAVGVADRPMDQWAAWQTLACPVLVIHGLLSNVLMSDTLERMRRKPLVTVMHVPHTGHTPALADANHLSCLQQWLLGGAVTGDFSSPYCAGDDPDDTLDTVAAALTS